MATAYTSLLGLALPVTGELSGTWGTTVNDSITQLTEDAIAGVATQSVASGDWTLTTTGSGASNQARMAILIPTGSPGVSRNIIAPSKSKAYIVINQSNAAVVIKGAATTGVSISAGGVGLIAWNGSDFVAPAVSSGTVTSVGGTGTVNGISLSGTVTSSGSLTLGGTLSGVSLTTQVSGTLPVANGGTGVTTSTGTGNVVLSSNPTLTGYTETVYTLGTSGSLALNPANGTVQSCAAAGTITFTDSLSSGQSISLLLTNGSSYTINYPTITWVSSAGNVAPTLSSNNTLVFWKISTTLYGALVGKSA